MEIFFQTISWLLYLQYGMDNHLDNITLVSDLGLSDFEYKARIRNLVWTIYNLYAMLFYFYDVLFIVNNKIYYKFHIYFNFHFPRICTCGKSAVFLKQSHNKWCAVLMRWICGILIATKIPQDYRVPILRTCGKSAVYNWRINTAWLPHLPKSAPAVILRYLKTAKIPQDNRVPILRTCGILAVLHAVKLCGKCAVLHE